jgi:Putative peptidoglycan binding domain
MAKGGGGGIVFAAVLIGAIAFAPSNDNSSGSTASSSSTSSASGSSSQSDGFNFFSETKSGTSTSSGSGGACTHTTTFTSNEGKFLAPATGGSSMLTQRSCVMGPNKGEGAPTEALQTALVHCYFQPLQVDGDYGSSTQASVLKLQQFLHIHADGLYGPQTAGAMQWPTTADDGKTACVKHPL